MLHRPTLKALTFISSFFLLVLLIGAIWIWVISLSLPDVGFLSNPGVSLQINVSDWKGNAKPFTVGPENPFWTPLSNIPVCLRNAVIAGEDFSFYGHNGVDWFEVKESFFKNLELGRFARGASTITQQLAKNLFLSREKTVTRKVRELIVARRLEKHLTKDRILELYLNIVELGDMVYGVGQGAIYHFGTEPAFLSLRESTCLAAMLPGPRVYDPARHLDRIMNRSDHLLGVMLKGRMITEEEYMTALNEMPFSYGFQLPMDPSDVPEILEENTAPSIQATAQATHQELLDRMTDPAFGLTEKAPVQVPIPGNAGSGQ